MLTRSWHNEHYISVQEYKANPVPPAITPICKIDLMNDSPIELARQLTLIEFGMWERIDIFDYLLQDLNDSQAMNATIERFNRVSNWVATEIVKVPIAKKRAFIIKQFISIAQACFEMNNFNTLLEITAGLNLVPIRRLKKTWRVNRYFEIFSIYTFLHILNTASSKEIYRLIGRIRRYYGPPPKL